MNLFKYNNEDRPLLPGREKKSSFTQSVINTVNLLVGVCVLSLPFTFKIGGWFFGIGMILVGAFTTLYTGFLLRQCLDLEKATTLGELGRLAFGPTMQFIVSSFYVFELSSCAVSYVIIVGDTLSVIFPNVPLLHLKIIGAFIMIASSWTNNLVIISYSSILGILASICMVLITVYDGLSVTTSPGSLLQPAMTSLFPEDPLKLFLNMGLVIYIYSGHSVIPSIYKSMKDPTKFNKMLSLSYLIVVSVWFLFIPTCIYLMFGNTVQGEFTLNLYNHPEYNKTINGMFVWLIVTVPLTKYSLLMNPVAQVFEYPGQINRFRRTLLGLVILYTGTMFEFTKVLGFIGAFFSFFVTIVFPCACHLKLFPEANIWTRYGNILLITFGILGGVAGSVGLYLYE